MLRDAAAPGDAEHVDAVVAESGEHLGDEPAQAAEPIRAGRQRRPAHSWYVEADHLDAGIQRVDERREQFQAGADAVDEQQRHDAGGRSGCSWGMARSGINRLARPDRHAQ
jgi:hypothetical protein